MDEPLLRPLKINSPNRNILYKETLRRVAQNKNILLRLQISSFNSQNAKPVSNSINNAKLGENTH
jgi:hypothetical protein